MTIHLELRAWNGTTEVPIAVGAELAYSGQDKEESLPGIGATVAPSAVFDLSGLADDLSPTGTSTFDVWDHWSNCTTTGCEQYRALWASVVVVVKDVADPSIVYSETWVDGYVVKGTQQVTSTQP